MQLVSSFDIGKAKRDIDYNPVDFKEGIKIMHQQIKKYEVENIYHLVNDFTKFYFGTISTSY